jgi:hypothetical protein
MSKPKPKLMHAGREQGKVLNQNGHEASYHMSLKSKPKA